MEGLFEGGEQGRCELAAAISSENRGRKSAAIR
jgi:hypothetical protein